MDKKDEIILQQLDVIRTMTQNNLNRMGSDLLCRLMKDKRVDSVVCAADAGRAEIRRPEGSCAQSKRAEERGRRKAEQACRLHRRGREKGRGSAASPAREDRGP